MSYAMVILFVICLMLGVIGRRVGVTSREAWTISVIGLALVVGVAAGLLK